MSGNGDSTGSAGVHDKNLADQLRIRLRQQAVVSDLGVYALSGSDVQSLMDEAVVQVAETLEMDYCKVLELLPSGTELLLRAGVGWREGLVGVGTVGSDLDSQAGFTLRSKEPVIVDDLRTDSRFRGPPLLVEHEVISGMSVIIYGPEGPFGVLGAHTRYPRTFSRDDIHFLQSVANVLGAAIQRRRFEEELQRAHTELEWRVDERTNELRRAYEELEAFSYSVSHDLRAPLRGIDGFTHALLEDYGGDLPEGAKRYLKRVRAGTIRMSELIESLLELSRLTRIEVAPREVDLTAMAHEVARGLRNQEADHGVEFEVEDGLTLVADEALTRVVMENLLENAWKFTRRQASPRIEVGAVPGDEDKTFFVRDNGAGFEMTYADKLFVPFQRLHEERDFEGNGVGLATVKRVIDRHGGSIRAEGAPGAGACFYFSL